LRAGKDQFFGGKLLLDPAVPHNQYLFRHHVQFPQAVADKKKGDGKADKHLVQLGNNLFFELVIKPAQWFIKQDKPRGRFIFAVASKSVLPSRTIRPQSGCSRPASRTNRDNTIETRQRDRAI